MPIARFEMPDGRVARFEVPAGLSPEDAQNLISSSFLNKQPEAPKERTFGEAAKDIGAGITSGVGSLVQLPGQLYGLATGNFEDTGLLGLGKSIAKSGEEMKSEALKQKEAQRSQRIQEAEKKGQWEAFKTAAGETIKDPALLTSFLAEQAPQMIVPFGAAKVGKALTMGKGLGAGLAAEEAAQAAGTAGTRAAIGAGAVQQGADIGTGTYENVYKTLVDKGTPQEEAKSQALNLARASGASGAIISLLAQKLPGAKTLEESFAGVPGTTGRLLGAAKGALGEATSEVAEETGGKFAQNLAMRQVSPEQELTQGLGATAGMAAIGGAGFGGVAGGLRTPQGAPQPAQATQPSPVVPEAPQIDPDKYRSAIEQLRANIPEAGISDAQKIADIFKTAGIQDETEISSYVKQATDNGDIKAHISPFFDVKDANGATLFRTTEQAIADKAAERLNAEEPNKASVAPIEITTLRNNAGYPPGYDIKQGRFKQQEFDIVSGDIVLSPKPMTMDDVDQKAQRLAEIRKDGIKGIDKEVKGLQEKADQNNLSVESMEAEGQANTPEYATLSQQVVQDNLAIQKSIEELTAKKTSFTAPLLVRPAKASDEGFTVFQNGKPLYYFPTLEQAEETVDAAPTSVPTQEAIAAKEALRQTLLPFMRRVGLEGTGLRIMDSIESAQGSGDGYYAQNLIAIALSAPNPMATLRHETIHALKELGAFTDQEWKLLESTAKKDWINRFIKNRNTQDGKSLYEAYKAIYLQDKGSLEGFDSYITEEAIADAFKYFNANGTPPGMLSQIFAKIKAFLESLGNQFSGLGFQTADQVFKRVEMGQMRPTRAAPVGNAPRYEVVSLEGKRKDIFTDPDTLEAWKAIGRNNLTQPVAERFSTRSRDEAEREVYKKYLTKKDILEAARIQGDVKPSFTTEEGSAGNQYIQNLLNERSNDRYLDEIEELKKAGPTEMGRAQEAFGETVEDNRTDAQKARGTMAYNRERVEFLKKTPEELQDLAAQHAYGVAYSDQAEGYQEAQEEGVTLSDDELEKISDVSYKSAYSKELKRLQNRQEKLRSEREAPRFALKQTPATPTPTAAVAKAPTAVAVTNRAKPTKVMSMEDLGKVIPASERVVSKNPSRLLNGKKFSKANLNKVGEGFFIYKEYGESDAEGLVKKIWEDSIADVEDFVSGSRVGTFIQDLVKSLGAKPPTAKFLNDSFSLSDSARYWYETSAEALDQTTLNIKNKDLLINLISATSQNVPPLPNMRRGISVMSEYTQGKPIETDLISKKPVADAISNRDIQTLKFGNFADTMKFINGYTPNPPVSTNDRQVAAIFNMQPDEFAKNPVLYAVVSKFYAKIRDSQNKMQGEGKQPYESWQIQALNWVEERGNNTSYGTKTADSYDQAIEVITEQLKNAGIPLEKGKIGMSTLKDPRVPNLLSGTMDVFQDAVKATVESNTLLNKSGSEANQEYEKIKSINEPWARNLRKEFLMIQTRVLKNLSSSKAIETIAKLATGQNVKAFAMSRMDATARGTFEGNLSPNIRIPMFYRNGATKTLITDPEINFILSVLGSGLDQAAMAGSLFKPDINGETYRVFLPDRKITDDEATTFEKNVGFPLNLYDVPNGAVVEINIGGYDTRPTAASVQAALNATFGNNVNAKIAKASYKSTYLTKEKVEYAPSYREVIYDYRDSKFGRGNKNGFRRAFDDRLTTIAKQLIAIARERDGQFEEFTKDSREKRTAYEQKIGSKTDWAVMGGPSGGKYQLTAARINVDGVMRPTRNSRGAFIATTPEGIQNFWRWFGNSIMVDSKGFPRVMMHGTARDFERFMPKQAEAIFVTDEPFFAQNFSQLSEDWISKNYDDPSVGLTDEDIKDAKRETLSKMDDLTRREYGLNMKTDPQKFIEYGIDEWRTAVLNRAETRANTVPLYVKLENPFNYQNKDHVKMVVDEMTKNWNGNTHKFETDTLNLIETTISKKQLDGYLSMGDWGYIEHPETIAAIKNLDFDGITMREDMADKNYAVFKQANVKSAVGNLGAFGQRELTQAERKTESKREGRTVTAKEAKIRQAEGYIRYSISSPDTQPFKRWFKDSRVVDKDGNPLVMYHATKTPEEGADLFSVFNKSDDGKLGQGIYTTAVEKYAESFAPNGVVMPLWVSIQNPLYLDLTASIQKGRSARDILRSKVAGEEPSREVDYLRLDGNGSREISNSLNAEIQAITGKRMMDMSGASIKRALQKAGYDGIIVRDTDGNFVEVNAFDQTQIKSAIGNRGTYSESNKDIRYSISSPNTPEFKRWFGDSKVVDGDGKPLVAYHGTTSSFNVFETKQVQLGKPRRKTNAGELGSWFAAPSITEYDEGNAEYIASSFTEDTSPSAGLDDYKTGANVMPVYLSIKKPYDAGDYESLMDDRDEYGSWKALRKHLEGEGYDGIVIYGSDTDGNVIRDDWVAFNPTQIKSATGNRGTFDEKNPDIRYSLRDAFDADFNATFGTAGNDALNRATYVRQEKGFAQRIAEAISPDRVTAIRQKLLNKYEAVERLSKMVAADTRPGFLGAKELLADVSANAAALQADRAAGVAAEALMNGIPVYEKGYTKVTDMGGKVKGLIPILEPLLKKYQHPKILQMFQFYSATRRGIRLYDEGREHVLTPADFALGDAFEVKYPEFKTAYAEYQKFNEGLVKFLIDTGVLSKAMGAEWTKYGDYIPFYRQIDGKTTVGPKMFQNLSGVKPTPELTGGDKQIGDYLETVVRNTRSAIEQGMKNVAAQRIVRDIMRLNTQGMNDMGRKLQPHEKSGSDVVTVRENGDDVRYQVIDPLLVESMKSLHNMGINSFWTLMSYPTQLLRNLVTKEPSFILANLARDSMQAWVTSGVSMTPLVDTFKQFGKVLANQSPEAKALRAAGIGTGYEFSGDIKSSAKAVADALNDRAGIKTGWQKAMWPVSKVWDALDKGSNASDLATRAEIYKKVLAETGNEAEAIYQSLEVMNFGRMGSSPMIQVISALVPFFNARVQGMDVLYRAGFGRMATQNSKAQHKAFMYRALFIAAMSSLYWFMARDTDEWKRASKETRDNYWLIGNVKIPIPFEIGVLFKVAPERILETAFGNDTGEDLAESALRNIISTLKINPVPQAFLPILEESVNYSLFTGMPIVGRGMENVAAPYQRNSSTTELSIMLGEQLNLSPIRIDHVLSAYTGSMGMYMAQMIGGVINTVSGSEETRPAMSIEQTPVLKRFFASDKAGGTIDAFYSLKKEVDVMVRTQHELQSRGNPEQYAEYMEKNGQLLGLKGLVSSIDRQLTHFRELRNKIQFSSLDPQEKRETLDNIRYAEIAITENIKEIKKNVLQ